MFESAGARVGKFAHEVVGHFVSLLCFVNDLNPFSC